MTATVVDPPPVQLEAAAPPESLTAERVATMDARDLHSLIMDCWLGRSPELTSREWGWVRARIHNWPKDENAPACARLIPFAGKIICPSDLTHHSINPDGHSVERQAEANRAQQKLALLTIALRLVKAFADSYIDDHDDDCDCLHCELDACESPDAARSVSWTADITRSYLSDYEPSFSKNDSEQHLLRRAKEILDVLG